MNRFGSPRGNDSLARAKGLHHAVGMEIGDVMERAEDYVVSYDQHGVGDLAVGVTEVS